MGSIPEVTINTKSIRRKKKRKKKRNIVTCLIGNHAIQEDHVPPLKMISSFLFHKANYASSNRSRYKLNNCSFIFTIFNCTLPTLLSTNCICRTFIFLPVSPCTNLSLHTSSPVVAKTF